MAAVRRYRDEIGGLEWAAPMDWMCEPFMLAKTGLTVAEHQARTVANYLELRSLAPELPFVPVLQGWSLDNTPSPNHLDLANRLASGSGDRHHGRAQGPIGDPARKDGRRLLPGKLV